MNCIAITWQTAERGSDYVPCGGPATGCIIVGHFRHERGPLCEAHQRYFIESCKWVVIDAQAMQAVEFYGRARYLVSKEKCQLNKCYEREAAALAQIESEERK